MKVFVIKKRSISLFVNIVLAVFVVTVLLTEVAVNPVMANRRNDPITCVETDKNEVALTFNLTQMTDIEAIMKALGENKATFFVNADYLQLFPAEVKRLSDAGHCIAILAENLRGKTKNEVNDVLADRVESMARVTKLNPDLVRFDGNSYDGNCVKATFTLGLYPVQWSSDDTVEVYYAGDIILVTNMSGISDFVQKLTKGGFTLVTVDNLILKSDYEIDLSGRQSKKQ